MMGVPSVVTNVVMCFAITTTRPVPVPCPDGFPGCCVFHTKDVSETRYEPVKISNRSGLAWDCLKTFAAMEERYGSATNAPAYIPLSVFHYPFDGAAVKISSHPIGWIVRDELIRQHDELVHKKIVAEPPKGGWAKYFFDEVESDELSRQTGKGKVVEP